MKWRSRGVLLVATLSLVAMGVLEKPVVAAGDGQLRSEVIKPTQGRYGSVPFHLTSAGVLHLGAGTLPEYKDLHLLSGFSGQLLAAVTKAYLHQNNIMGDDMDKISSRITKVVFDGPVVAPVNAKELFENLKSVTTYEHFDRLDTHQTVNMAHMLADNYLLTSLDLSHFDTSQVTTTNNLFMFASSMPNIDVTNLDLDKDTDIHDMFWGMTALHELDLSHQTFRNVKNASLMISHTSIQRVNLAHAAPKVVNGLKQIFVAADTLAEVTLGPQAQTGQELAISPAPRNDQFTGNWQAVGTGTVKNPLGKKYSDNRLIGNDPTAGRQVETYVWEPVNREISVTPPAIVPPTVVPPTVVPPTVEPPKPGPEPIVPPQPGPTSQPVTLQYLDEADQPLANERQMRGKIGETYRAIPLEFTGYRLRRVTGRTVGTFGVAPQMVTFRYAQDTHAGGSGNTIAPLKSVVYAKRRVGLYATPNFNRHQVKHWYGRQARTRRPMFVVTGLARSRSGLLRYRVRDVNHHSKTAGMTGYLTARPAWVTSVYYQHKLAKVRVLNPQGVNVYHNRSLRGKTTHIRQGHYLRIRKIVAYHRARRFEIQRGGYVTANKKLVIW
ncbi:DUF5776 domain-containing protein [Levilactobacillus tangyuanensis]|uniref:DUF5776 domain-containing protein n=1 Tax=Levilactobacillus tangyuanensis TaxID=2486021 RepID=A0ABW1TM86_9LACO|nr:DUF5776 domain-containing protein [Levilactobacillus tangyuanensis]